MSKPAARINDQHTCPKETPSKHSGGTIKSGSPNVLIGGQPAARVGDAIECEEGSSGSIQSSNACLMINGKPAARIDDATDHDGKISSGFSAVTIADGEPFVAIGNNGLIEIGANVFFGE